MRDSALVRRSWKEVGSSGSAGPCGKSVALTSRLSRGSVDGAEDVGDVTNFEEVSADALDVSQAKRLVVVLVVCAVEVRRGRLGLVYGESMASSSSSSSSSSSPRRGGGRMPMFRGSEVALTLKKLPKREALDVCFGRVPAVLALLVDVSVLRLVMKLVRDLVGDACGEGVGTAET